MKKIVFLCSHLYSGSSALYEIMNRHPQIQGYRSPYGNSYVNPKNLIELTSQHHKLKSKSAFYMDEILFNHFYILKNFYDKCKFIYVLREPEAVLNFLTTGGREINYAVRYYQYRLRRLCEMARMTPGAILLNWRDISTGSKIDLIEEYLELKEPLRFNHAFFSPYRKNFTNLIDHSIIDKAQDVYERYFYFLKNQKLIY
jgi:hypothetical protein